MKFSLKSFGKSLWTSVTGWWSSNYVRSALNALGIVLLLVCAVYLELPRERKPQSDKCVLLERGDSEESATFYAKTATSGYRRVRSRRVTLVPLREDVEPSRVINNVCEQRWYIAKLVKELNAAGATSIVLDKFFGPDSCPEKDPGTSDLIAAIDSSRIPVTVGVGTHTPKTDPRNVCLIESPTLDFGNKHDAKGNPTSVPAVLRGLVRLNSDVKKIPTNWFSYRSDDAFNAHATPTDSDVGTLSSVAASQLDRDLQDEPALERLRTAGQHPFTSFIDPDAFSHVDALGILCVSKFKAKIEERYHVDCAQHPRGDAQIEGRVIVIGEDVSGRDRHTLFGNDVSGAYLQANYIESLLDGRYLRPFGAGWDLIVFAAWLVFLYLIFWIQPEIALAISLAIGFLVKYLIVQLVVWKGLYPQIWIQDLGALALVLKYIDSRGHRIIEAIEKRWFHHPPPGGPGGAASTAAPPATTSPGTVPKAS